MCACVCARVCVHVHSFLLIFIFPLLSLFSAHTFHFNSQPPPGKGSLEPQVGVSVGIYTVQGVRVEPTVCQLQIYKQLALYLFGFTNVLYMIVYFLYPKPRGDTNLILYLLHPYP